MTQFNTQECFRFYQAAVCGLYAIESGQERRFGANADANWKAFKGELQEGDRINLMLRDVAAIYPAAFSPRVVFAISGLADDEPFGPDWPGITEADAVGLRGKGAPSDINAVLVSTAALWNLKPIKLPENSLSAIGPATRLVASGAGALLSLAGRFSSDKTLDLVEQIIWVTDSPAERQLFGLAAALLQNNRPVTFCDTASLAQPSVSRLLAGRTALLSEEVPEALRTALLSATGKGA